MRKTNNLPIGVFDSGVGGLTVLQALRQHLPNESFLYLGDTARLPYGTKSANTVINYSLQACQQLVNFGIKLLVVACNTASAHALPRLQQTFPDIPVIGVIEPGARAAVQASASGHIAVIATEATIHHQAYEKAILTFNPKASVIGKSCPLFVALAEEGWIEGDIPERTAQHYLTPLFENARSSDCLVLGCTHFPAMLPAIRKALATDISIVDSASTTAETVAQVLEKYNLLCDADRDAHLTFLATDNKERFVRVAKNLLEYDIPEASIELIDFKA